MSGVQYSATDEQVLLGVALHRVEPVGKEPRRDVLHRVEPEAVDARRVEVPAAPGRDLVAHLLALEVEVGSHQVGEVAVLERHLVVELLALDQVHRVLLARVAVVVVDGVEVPGAPLERRVPALAAREAEARVALDLARLALGPQAVVLRERRGARDLGRVAAHAVVEHHVGVDLEPRLLQRLDRRHVLGLRAVLGADAALLVELAEVVHVVDAVADVAFSARALVGRRQPDAGEARPGELLRARGGLVPDACRRRSCTSGRTAS